MPSRLRHTLERKGRALAAGGGFIIKVISGGLELDEAINAYEQIYASSWKKSEPYPTFMPELIRLCARRGWLRLGLAYINHEVVAVQLWIVHQRKASIYKLAHDPHFDRYSVGTLLTNHMMRHVIEVDRVGEVDYLIGDETYKKDWMTRRRERWGLIAYNPNTLAGVVMAAQEFASYQVKRARDWLWRNLRACLKTKILILK
ncbi:MAG: GNAT family N-acetyltransferase [Chromatiales bacterium]|nr:GNAT family N-acetyltransferase [Chromatiales bacterium]